MGLTGWTAVVLGAIGVALAAGFVVQRINESQDAGHFPPPGQLIDIGGRRLHVLCKGAGAGPTVVIEQGLASPSILWWPVQDAVAAFARVCTYDRAGYQWSDPAPVAQGVHEMVSDLHALLDTANVPQPYVLVGHSFGGPLVRLFARAYPEEVAGVVLVDTPDEGVVLRESFAGYNRSLRRMFAVMRAAAGVGLIRWVMNLQARPLQLAASAAGVLGAKAGTPVFFRTAVDNARALEQMAAEWRSGGGLGSLGDRPLIVITHGIPFPGAAAVLEEGWSEGQSNLAALSTNSELIVATRSNHMINNDEPELVVGAIRRVHAAARDRKRLVDY